MKTLLINLIEFYQTYLSFDKGALRFFAPAGACKYQVSCSQYAKKAIGEFGVIWGGWLTIKRIWSCR